MGLNDLQFGQRLNEILRRRFGIQQQPAPVMATEMFPVVPIEGPSAPPDYEWLGGGSPYFGFTTQVANAGGRSVVALKNPGDSGILATVLGVQLTCAVASFGGLEDETVFPGGVQSYSRDSRDGYKASPLKCDSAVQAVLSFPTGAKFPAISGNSAWGGNVLLAPVILHPGWALAVGTASANQTLDCGFYWLQRAFNPYEVEGARSP